MTASDALRSVDPHALHRRPPPAPSRRPPGVGRRAQLRGAAAGVPPRRLTWSDDRLVGWPIAVAGSSPVSAALEFAPAAVALGDDRQDLDGRTYDEIVRAMRSQLEARGFDPARLALRLPGDLEPGPIQSGATMAVDAALSAGLGRWFGFANAHLAEAASAHGVSISVPCWPDHFDLAVAVMIDGAPAAGAQVTLGFSPGDGSIDEPYFYITPWPVPVDGVAGVPAPAGGRWHVEGWTGLALPASAILVAPDADSATAAFLGRGFEIARDLVLTG